LASVTTGLPSVSVPVLSKAMQSMAEKFSIAMPPLKRIPRLAALEMAERTAGVADAIKAQGEATVNSTMPR